MAKFDGNKCFTWNRENTALARTRLRAALPLVLGLGLAAGPAFAHDPEEGAPASGSAAAKASGAKPAVDGEASGERSGDAQYSTTVQGQRPPTSAGQRTIRGEELMTRARSTPYDYLRLVPNMVIGLHEGGGKAPQYLLRGFDADHGTDLAMYFDGIPVNEVSHVHGLGYLDIHFIIPELVARLDVSKGPYDAENGSFANAGTIRLTTRTGLPQNEVGYTFGSFESHRVLGLFSPKLSPSTEGLFAIEGHGGNGYTASGQNQRYNLFSKVRFKFGGGTSLDVMALSYGADWNAPGLIAERTTRPGYSGAGDAGGGGFGADAPLGQRKSPFGAFDPSDGGTSQRNLLALTFERKREDGTLRTQTYLMLKRLTLFHDFTGFTRGPQGDQFVQQESRTTFGGELSYAFSRSLGDVRFDTKLGAQWRFDDLAPSLWNTTNRERRSLVYERQMQQTDFSGYAKELLSFGRRLSLELGARYDLLFYDVVDPHEELATLGTKTSGTRHAAILNPKASLVYRALDHLHFYANFGTGFRAADARTAVLSVFPGLARSTGAEGGVRAWLWDHRIELAATGWWMDSERDVVFVADEGANEEVGPARRYGFELEARARLFPWLWLDFDFSATRARFRDVPDAQAFVPRAPQLLAAGGVQVRHPSGFFGSLRARHVGAFALVEDNSRTSQAYTVADLVLGYETKRFQVALNVQNLFNTAWRDSEYYYASSVSPVREPTPVNDVHFRQGEPLLLQVNLKLFF